MAAQLPLPPPPPDPQFVLRGTQSAVHALHFWEGAQGQGHPLLLSGSLSGLVHIWSLQTRRAVATLDGHGGQCVTWLQTLPQGHQLLRAGTSGCACGTWRRAETPSWTPCTWRAWASAGAPSWLGASSTGHWLCRGEAVMRFRFWRCHPRHQCAP
uniref:G protein subunit beta 1 like n=1 Tax=Rousettus aegyptiacus TaxID=9407 RepID=A0A7J8GZP8_ROUAE|nr:G protein subunit beta 1 like [Rousettus aegyptiacus]